MDPRLGGRPVEVVFIDAGGVLVDPNWETVSDVLGRHGIEAAPEQLADAEPRAKLEVDDAAYVAATTDTSRAESLLERVLRLGGIRFASSALEGAAQELAAIHRAVGVWEVVIEGVPQALDRLRAAGLRLALVSNADPGFRSKLGSIGLASRFEQLFISMEMGVEKPDPAIFHRALEAMDADPERTIHTGDLYEVDVMGARAAGLADAVLVDRTGLYVARDVRRVRSLAELPSLLGV